MGSGKSALQRLHFQASSMVREAELEEMEKKWRETSGS